MKRGTFLLTIFANQEKTMKDWIKRIQNRWNKYDAKWSEIDKNGGTISLRHSLNVFTDDERRIVFRNGFFRYADGQRKPGGIGIVFDFKKHIIGKFVINNECTGGMFVIDEFASKKGRFPVSNEFITGTFTIE